MCVRTYGKHSVVREEEHVGDDVPCLCERQVLLINEDAHQLRDRKRRVRVVELDGDVCVNGIGINNLTMA